MLHGPKRTQTRAKQLRRKMSLPEVLLLMQLRKRPAGLKFRNQHPAGRYIVDFFCAECRLAIEIDGEGHACGDRPARDYIRDAWLRSHGITVVRIPASEVLKDIGAVVRHIVGIARGGYPSTAFGGPPPPPGED